MPSPTLRELVTQLGGDVFSALLKYRENSMFFKAFIYFINNIVENDLYFNSQIAPWEILSSPSFDISTHPSLYPIGFSTLDEVIELKFYLTQWWLEFKLRIHDYFKLERNSEGKFVIMPELEDIHLRKGRDMLSGYLQHFNNEDFQFLVELNFPSLFQTDKDKRRGRGSISFGWTWFLGNNNRSQLQLNQSYNKTKVYDPTLRAYSKVMVPAYIRGFNYNQLYHQHYPKQYVEFDGIWIDFSNNTSQYRPNYRDFMFSWETPVMIVKQLILWQGIIVAENDFTSSGEDDDNESMESNSS